MRAPRSLTAFAAMAALLVASPCPAEVLDDAAVNAEPQYYLMSLPSSDVEEIAAAVLGEALGLPFQVDEAVQAEMPFRVDGVYSARALAQEFGYRLWNVDVALIEKPSDGLWLIREADLAPALAAGAVVVSPTAASQAQPPSASATAAQPRVVAASRDPAGNWSWLGWLGAGWAAGVASVTGYGMLRARSGRRIARLPAPTQDEGADVAPPGRPAEADFIIPNFGEARPGKGAAERRN